MNNEKTENYMDKFETPEEFIRHQILARGNFSTLQKKDLYQMIRKQNIDFTPNKSKIKYFNKFIMRAQHDKMIHLKQMRHPHASKPGAIQKMSHPMS